MARTRGLRHLGESEQGVALRAGRGRRQASEDEDAEETFSYCLRFHEASRKLGG